MLACGQFSGTYDSGVGWGEICDVAFELIILILCEVLYRGCRAADDYCNISTSCPFNNCLNCNLNIKSKTNLILVLLMSPFVLM